MVKEYSYGAVVYKIEDNRLFILIEFMACGHISIPKGHIEDGETPEKCALREIKEETNLDVELDTNFSHVVSYSPKPNVVKDVTFYVAKAISNHLIPQFVEVRELKWLSYENAIGILTHDSDKETVRLAYEYLKNKTSFKN